MQPNSTASLIPRPTQGRLMLEEQPHHLSIEQRIMKCVLFVFFVILIVPIFIMKWSNVKILCLEAYDGMDRSHLLPVQREVTTNRFSLRRFFGPSFQSELIALDKQIREECHLLERDIKILRKQIKTFDQFVMQHKDLFEVCQTYLQLFPQYISHPSKIPSNLNLNDPIDLHTKLWIERNNLEHMRNERKRFILRHKEVYNAFEKALEKHKYEKTNG